MLLLFASLAVFLGTVPGLAWPLARRLPLDPAEKLLASTALSLLGIFLLGWVVYIAALPLSLLWLAPALGVGFMFSGRNAFAALLRNPAARALAVGQLIVTAWCLAWLALVATYSGGGWTSDWFEHWERARFFLDRGARDVVFIDHAALTARPPLANILVGVLLALVRVDFPVYQIASTLLASLVFLPTGLLARRFGGDRAITVAVVLTMLSPLFVQNATFAWTKLPSAFFVLGGLYFFLDTLRAARPLAPAVLCAALLAAGLLAHYSAGPYVVLIGGGWLIVSWRRRSRRDWWQSTAAAVVAGGVVLALWFGWALAVYGLRGTALSNTSVTAADSQAGGQLVRIVLNLRDTLVPHVFRSLDTSLIAQKNSWGALRDTWFQLYQVNLLFAFGSLAWLVLLVAAARAWRISPATTRLGWAAFAAGSIVLGVGVHGARDTWGLAHICLQPLVLLGLAFLAAAWDEMPRIWRGLVVVGAVVDAGFGLALHFAVQNLAFERWAGPAAFASWQADNSLGAVMNMAAKLQHRLVFFGEALGAAPSLIVLILFALAACALWRARPSRSMHLGS